MTQPTLTEAATAMIELLDQYDLDQHLAAARDTLNQSLIEHLLTTGIVIVPTPWKTRGAPPLDRGPILAAIRENAAKPPSERLTQAELAKSQRISVKTLAKVWRESLQSP